MPIPLDSTFKTAPSSTVTPVFEIMALIADVFLKSTFAPSLIIKSPPWKFSSRLAVASIVPYKFAVPCAR